MRKPIMVMVLATLLGLWLGPDSLAGDRAAQTRLSAPRVTTATEARLAGAGHAEQLISWLRGIARVAGLLTPIQPVFTPYGISDEPDPTSSRGPERERRPGVGPADGGVPLPEPPEDSSDHSSGSVTLNSIPG